MNKTQHDKFDELLIQLENKYSEHDSVYGKAEVVEFVLDILKEQAIGDILFLNDMLLSIHQENTEIVNVMINDWMRELEKLIGDED